LLRALQAAKFANRLRAFLANPWSAFQQAGRHRVVRGGRTLKELTQKMKVFGLGESIPGCCEVLCTGEGFTELMQAIVDRLDPESAKNLIARTGDDCRTIAICRVPKREPPPARFRDKLFAAGCLAVLITVAVTCFSLMSLGFGVVMGWVEQAQ
jgi:hypothetical protein